MSDGEHGHGVELKIGATTIANIISIGGPDESKDSLDISTMDSATKFREFIPGMLDGSEITMEINYDGSAAGTANDLNTLYRSTATETITIDFNDHATPSSASSFACVGFITTLGHAIPFDDKITQSLTIKLTGVPTYLDRDS